MVIVETKLINSMRDLTLMIWKELMKFNLLTINLMMKSLIFMDLQIPLKRKKMIWRPETKPKVSQFRK